MQLQEVGNKLHNEKTAYETLSAIHKEVSAKFMRSIKELVDEKNARQDAVDKVREHKNIIEKFEKENVST